MDVEDERVRGAAEHSGEDVAELGRLEPNGAPLHLALVFHVVRQRVHAHAELGDDLMLRPHALAPDIEQKRRKK